MSPPLIITLWYSHIKVSLWSDQGFCENLTIFQRPAGVQSFGALCPNKCTLFYLYVMSGHEEQHVAIMWAKIGRGAARVCASLVWGG